MKKIINNIIFLGFICAALTSCATYTQQVGKKTIVDNVESTNDDMVYEVIAFGNIDSIFNPSIKRYVNSINTDKSIVLLGDIAVNEISSNIDFLNQTKVIVVPGDKEWNNGIDSLKNWYNKITIDTLNIKTPLINKPINELVLNNNITLITIDSEWFIQNWDYNIDINQNSYFKNRDDFFDEFHRLINKNQNKIVLVAMHHPIINNGFYGGYYAAKDHLLPIKNIPLPIIGTGINFLRKTAGIYPTDTQYTYYRNLTKRLKTIAKNQSNIVFISAHENSLQFIEDEGIQQVISGSASYTKEARSVQPNSYTNAAIGFASIGITKNNEAILKFFTIENDETKIAFTKKIIVPEQNKTTYDKIASTHITTSVYPSQKVKKSKTYQLWFGKHFRDVYGTNVNVSVADFDKLYNGLTPVSTFADNKSNSLIVQNKEGKQFIMRRLGKSSKQFLQYDIFKDAYVKDKLNNTFLENFVDDYYTTMHPYAPLVLNSLSQSLKLHHSNPQLYFVPKQKGLANYNNSFGDAMYMIEANPNATQIDNDSFGNPEDIISTHEMLLNLEKSPKYQVNTEMYLRARYLDFLIGDWDRNPNQWLWAQKTKNDTIYYEPISRDHDQAFVKIDGILIQLVNKLNPFKHIHNYKNKFPKPRFATKSAFPLDRLLLNNTTENDWDIVAQQISNHLLTNDAITKAFDKLPSELSKQETNKIINILKNRRDHLPEFAKLYRKRLLKDVLVIGTNNNDKFIVSSSKNNITIHKFYNDTLTSNYTFNTNNTNEIWLYGLDGNDVFEIDGEKSKIKLKLIGGRGTDQYNTNTSIKIFDYESETNDIENAISSIVILKDQYALNQFDFRKVPLNNLAILPDLDYNRDNGIMIGLNAVYTINKFNQNPYTQKHQFKIKYSFATSGIDAVYKGDFKNYTNNGFWVIDAIATTDNFTRNFFGKANLATYNKNQFKDNYYRVRSSEFQFKPSYEWRGRNGSKFLLGATFESMKIEETNNRLIDEQLLTELFDTYKRTNYYGARFKYSFENYDDIQEPTLGFGFSILFGHRFLLKDANQNNQYLQSKLNFVVPLTNNKRFTWSSTHVTEMIFGNDYHFYQMASMGSQNGLRGYRQHRFIGDASYITSNDLRFKMNNIHNNIVPLSYGIYVGYDAGRIWNSYNKDIRWKHSYGAGFWLNTLNSFTAHVGVFSSSEETALVNFGLGFKFK